MAERHNLVSVNDFAAPLACHSNLSELIESLPRIHAGNTIRGMLSALIKARTKGRPVYLGMGAHVIKCGLAPALLPLFDAKALNGLALNGAGAIHDFELAAFGETSEDVSKELPHGRFGFVEETGAWMSEAIVAGAKAGHGLGEALYIFMKNQPERFPHRNISFLWKTGELKLPCTVHVAIGTDFIHLHPAMDGSSLGATTFEDFNRFCDMVETLEGGVYWNLGSAVVLPEVFLKAVSRAHNTGNHLHGMSTINMDMLMQYRATTNVIKRPCSGIGQGFHLTGHHEIMVPIVAGAFLEGLQSS